MTDSASKNLKIEDGVAERLNSTHIPYHILCKAHTVEAFDRSNLEVLSVVEKDVDFRGRLEKINLSVFPQRKNKCRGDCYDLNSWVSEPRQVC